MVLILPKWDIANSMVIYLIRKEKDVQYKTEEDIPQAHRGIEFSDDHQALVIWSIEKRDKTRMQEISSGEHIGAPIVYRIGEVSSENFFGMASKNGEIWEFGVCTRTGRFLELNAKFEEVLKAYEERGSQIQSLENNRSNLGKERLENLASSELYSFGHPLNRSNPPPLLRYWLPRRGLNSTL